MDEMNKTNFQNVGKVRKPFVSVRDFSMISEPKAELLEKFLSILKVEGKVLIIADKETEKNENLKAAADEMENVKIISINDVLSKDMMEADYLVVAEAALSEMTERLSK